MLRGERSAKGRGNEGGVGRRGRECKDAGRRGGTVYRDTVEMKVRRGRGRGRGRMVRIGRLWTGKARGRNGWYPRKAEERAGLMEG